MSDNNANDELADAEAALAAIGQLCQPPHWGVLVTDILAVLDGIPVTTQPADETAE